MHNVQRLEISRSMRLPLYSITKQLEQMTTSSPKGRQSPQKQNSSPTKSDTSTTAKQSKAAPLNVTRPSAEDLVDLERELQKLIAKKLQADTNLIKLETRLYDLETEYLSETQAFGNLVHGIEGYLGLPASVPANAPLRRGGPFNNSTSSLNTLSSQASSVSINPQQRLFSSTSTSFQKSLALSGRVPEAVANGYILPSATDSSSDLTSINGLRSKAQQDTKKSSPSKKNSAATTSKPVNNKNKKSESSGSRKK